MRRSRQNSSMSPITSTAASRASATDQCGAGWVSGTPGASTSAAIRRQSISRRSAVGMPALAACATRSALSSQPTTSAPPAKSALAATSPDPPRPNTATLRCANDVTGIMSSPQAPRLPNHHGARRRRANLPRPGGAHQDGRTPRRSGLYTKRLEAQRDFRIEPDCLLEVGERAAVLTLGAIGEATILVGDGVLGGELDRRVVVGDGVVVVALGAVRKATVVVADCTLGIELNHLAVVGNGVVVVPFGGVRDTPFVMGARVLGREPDRIAVIGDGAVVVALGAVGGAAVVVGDRVLRVEPDGLA